MEGATTSYDYVVVGAGPSGSVLATRLARSLKDFQILLVEAGGENADPEHQSYGDRHWTFATAPGYDWGYKTVPQEHLQGREIGYSRGKGLGGSTAINFCVFTRGPKADYEQWAHDVGDDTWTWNQALERMKELETFGKPEGGYKHYVEISDSVHGSNGPLHVGLPNVWDEEFGKYLNTLGPDYALNPDHNSGDPLGMAVCQVSALDGCRTTASKALLSDPPANLSVVTRSAVEKILFDENGQRAVGVKTSQGKSWISRCLLPLELFSADQVSVYARKEVILSAGALDSPKLLLLSGVGPRSELEKHAIPTIRDIPGIGKNLQDHLWLELVTVQKANRHHRTSYINSPTALEEARAEWMKKKSGPLADYFLPQMIAYLQSGSLVKSKEFQDLDQETQSMYQAETRPHYELISHIPTFSIQAPEKYLGTAVAFMSRQASGEVTLQSSAPGDAPKIDPKFLDHPFDRRVAIDSVRKTLEFLDTPGLAVDREKIGSGPKDRSDEEILASVLQMFRYIEATGISMWHMCGTVKMGKLEKPDTCVDKDFRVVGLQGLRVVDMSVAPLLPSAHTQAIAYLVGAIAADKIIAQHT
ncbi:MAG: hypothetical protein Q9216_005922 [Gyalolechia sp. 2 TL-2023]